MLDLSILNPEQRAAVEAPPGPVLVLAGAGSGKTRVLVYRIAWLIERGLAPAHKICAVTFTNRAAAEMAERVAKLVPGQAEALTVSTFHSLGARILRRDAERLGYKRDFVVYDDSDTLTLLKRVVEELGLNPERFPPRRYRSAIDKAKNALEGPEDVDAGIGALARFPEVYARYQERLKANNALDFGDLIRLPVVMWESDEEARRIYRDRFRWLLIDEYQDTNVAQYRFTRALAGEGDDPGLTGPFVVGDEDQSIYGFRGANIRNILEFQKEYPTARVVRLEQNYRSTSTILDAANAVVAYNSERLGKSLWSAQGQGEQLVLMEALSDQEEASRVAEELRRQHGAGHAWGDMAIFYRANALSRPFEEALSAARVPYQLVGQGFYDRREIRDARAYLQLVVNPQDEISLDRVINEPPRGIGDKAQEMVRAMAREVGGQPWDALARIHARPQDYGRAGLNLARFYTLIEGFRERARTETPRALLERILDESGYLPRLKEGGTIEDQSRIENLGELLNVAAEFENRPGLAGLGEMLERMSLRSGADDQEDDAGRVTLMTLHMAKGLEFPVVFLVGLEDGIFPNSRAREEGTLEEERRLCYVGMTRAMKRLYVSWARQRRHQGRVQVSQPSGFLREVPPKLVQRRGPGGGLRGFAPPRPAWQTSGEARGDREIVFDDLEVPAPGPRISNPQWSRPPASTPLRPSAARQEDDGPFRELMPGRNVSHPLLGDGRIIRREGPSDNPRLTIHFRKFGEKKIMARAAGLELLYG